MALVPHVKPRTQEDLAPETVAVLGLYAERFGAGAGPAMVTPDGHTAERLLDVAVAYLRRAGHTGVVHIHTCPHVTGQEEPTWTRCTDPQYGYREVDL